MATFYLPFVSRGDFPALEALLQTKRNYSNWLVQVAAWQTDAERQGHSIRQVRIEPRELRKYLDRRGFPYSREQILGYAEWCAKMQER
jgi:hypothetical protein